MFDQQKRVAFGLVLVSGAATSAMAGDPAAAQPPAATAPSSTLTAATPHCTLYAPPRSSGRAPNPADMRCFASEQEAEASFIDPTGTGFRTAAAAGGVPLAQVYDDPRATGQSFIIWGPDCNISGAVNVPAPLDNQVSVTWARGCPRLKVYKGYNGGGESAAYTGGTGGLFAPPGFDGQVRSVKTAG